MLLGGLAAQAEPVVERGASPTIRGRVLGLDGSPQALAVVRIFAPDGRRITEVVTDARGEFRYATRAKATPIVAGAFEVQWEGLVRRVEAGSAAEPVEISLAGMPHFTVRGRLLDPAGQPWAGVDLRLRDERGDVLCSVTTDPAGAWRLELGGTAIAIEVDPGGLGWRYKVELSRARELDLDLRQAGWSFLAVDGRVLDERGMPVIDALVTGVTVDGDAIRRPTRGDGSFVLWSRKPLERLVASRDGEPFALHFARFDRNQSCELDARVHGFVTVQGRVIEPLGAGVPYATILPADARGRPITGIATPVRADANGDFTARVPRELPRLVAMGAEPKMRQGNVEWELGDEVVIVVR